MRDALGLTLEEYGPEIVYIKGIHNIVTDAVSRQEYDPSVNQTAESFHRTKVRNKKPSEVMLDDSLEKLVQARHRLR